MSYQALYRKWRPATFREVVGQDAVVTTLQNQIKADRIGHAYLFCGTRGTGKTSAAKIFARAVNCPHAAELGGNPCNECEVCRAINSGRAMNVFEIDAASNNGVDNIRDIRDQVEYPPVTGRFKVYIIDEVHMLSPGAFNALLKTLEEPPAYVIFILATTDPQKIPATVLSRCQRYDFRRMSRQTITEHLKEITDSEGVKVEPQALEYIAEAGDGSMRDSLSLLDQCLAFHYGELLTYEHVLDILGAADTTIFSDLFRRLLDRDVEGAIALTGAMYDTGRDITQMVNDFIWHLRNVLIAKSSGSRDILELSSERTQIVMDDAELADRDTIIRIITAMAELANRLRFASQKRVQLEVEIIRLCTGGRAPAETPAVIPAAAGNAAAAGMGGARRTEEAAGRPAERPSPASAKIHVQISDSAEPARQSVIPERSTAVKERIPAANGPQMSGSAPERPGMTGRQAAEQPEAAQAAVPVQTAQEAQPAEPAQSAQTMQPGGSGDLLELVKQNWKLLISEMSPSNRPLFNGVILKEERGAIVLVFKNKINFSLAASNAEENGVIKLRELAQKRLGIRINFMARKARPEEIDPDENRATREELAQINFPISIED